MSRLSVLIAVVLALAAPLAVAHPGHHHETGFSDFAAHILLGLQYLAALVIPAAILAFFFRSARHKKTAANHPIHRQP